MTARDNRLVPTRSTFQGGSAALEEIGEPGGSLRPRNLWDGHWATSVGIAPVLTAVGTLLIPRSARNAPTSQRRPLRTRSLFRAPDP